MNNWNSEMDLTNKTIATRELIKRIPDLKGKNIVVMPSDSHNDILELIRQNKIDASTLFLIIDNIQFLHHFFTKNRFFAYWNSVRSLALR